MVLNNNNKKFIKTLSNNCLKANRNRNIIAVLAIILTAVLFTALATVAQGTMISTKEQMFRQAGTRYMVSIKGLSKGQADELAEDPVFTETGMERSIANAVNPEFKNLTATVGWMSKAAAENSFMNLEKGHYPEKDNEIACDTVVLDRIGQAGQRVAVGHFAQKRRFGDHRWLWRGDGEKRYAREEEYRSQDSCFSVHVFLFSDYAVLCCLLSAKILFFYYPPKEVRIFYLMVLIVSRLCSFVLFRSASFRWFRPDSGWKNVPEKFGNLWIILFLCNVAGQFSTASCFQLFFVIGIIWN